MDFVKTSYGTELTISPIYIFPILDDDYNLIHTERCVYNDVQKVHFDEKGNILKNGEPQ